MSGPYRTPGEVEHEVGARWGVTRLARLRVRALLIWELWRSPVDPWRPSFVAPERTVRRRATRAADHKVIQRIRAALNVLPELNPNEDAGAALAASGQALLARIRRARPPASPAPPPPRPVDS